MDSLHGQHITCWPVIDLFSLGISFAWYPGPDWASASVLKTSADTSDPTCFLMLKWPSCLLPLVRVMSPKMLPAPCLGLEIPA